MFPAMLFAISIVALAQFALYYWRAVFNGVACQPISSSILEAAQVDEAHLRGADFEKLAGLLELTPELKNSRRGLGFVPTYYKILGLIGDFFGRVSPALSRWSEQERVLCARYVAVQIEHRLEANLAHAASMRSF